MEFLYRIYKILELVFLFVATSPTKVRARPVMRQKTRKKKGLLLD